MNGGKGRRVRGVAICPGRSGQWDRVVGHLRIVLVVEHDTELHAGSPQTDALVDGRVHDEHGVTMSLHLGQEAGDSPTTAAMDARSSTGHVAPDSGPVPASASASLSASASASASNGDALAGDGPDADRLSTLGRLTLVICALEVLLRGLLYPAAPPRTAGRG